MSGLLIRLQSMCSGLADAERQVAEYVLSNPAEVPYQSVQEVSRGAKVSVASVSRLARKAGCRSFKDFKIELAQEVPTNASAVFEGIGKDDSDEQVVRKVFGANLHALEETLRVLDASSLIEGVGAIVKARRVVFFGIGSSGVLAKEAALRFVHLDIQAEAYEDSYQMLVQSARLGDKDVAVGISHSGRSAVTVEAVALARKRGATTLGLCNYHGSPLHEACDLFFVTAFTETRVKATALSSLIAQLGLIDAMYLLAAKKLPTLSRVDDVNQIMEERLRVPE
jgi:DNA-binding MurR/RpiR family transcriptional regulator